MSRYAPPLSSAIAAALVVFVAACADAQTVAAPRCGTGVHQAEATGTVPFPEDQIFCPLLADPKETRSFISYLLGEFRTLDNPSGTETQIGAIGIGDSFGLVRFGGPNAGDGLQLDVAGSIFAQFDLGTRSNDLINADYIVGVPATFRRRGFTLRARLYHQSSHLGDEYLLRDTGIERENLSFESIELIASQEIGALRVYGGGERLFRRDPDAVVPEVLHGGVEAHTARNGPLQLVAGVDLKASERFDWSPATSARVGLQLTRSGAEGHPWRLVALLLEMYQGPSPYGQFFQDDISYIGLGVHLGL